MHRRRSVRLLLTGGFLLAGSSLWAASAETAAADPRLLPVWTVLPFVGILLSIAVLPLISTHWWERNFGKVSLLWMAVAFLTMYLAAPGLDRFVAMYSHELYQTMREYISFILLLGTLYVISGGIVIKGSLSGKPVSNLLILAVGALLASLIGTTGAAMLLIRPLIKSIRWRRHKTHIIIFFIFLVCNIGGSLTPIGDPPLFIGFLRGVPFFWTLRLTPAWALTCGILLALFYAVDRHRMKREPEVPPDMAKKSLQLEGTVNFLFLLGVIAAVLFSGLIRLGTLDLGWGQLIFENVIRDVIMLALAGLSLRFTPRTLRQENNFNYAPIREVALLFVGIFTTMIPALMLLNARGAELGVDSASKFYWFTGILSSFLDNTPTYMTFLETARSVLHMSVAQLLASPQGALFIQAISVGAVFMGANTYIGNGPNFMVKSIAEQEQIRMPSFFGYMLWSICILLPVFILVDLVFFV
jgi:Na+/H+ antiporter NhaD/arsenite permease-like protein